MVVRKTNKGWFNRGIAMALMFRISHDLVHMSVSEFVTAMRDYNSHQDFVYITGIWNNRDRGQVWELNGTNIAMMPASTVNCRFYGGPPGTRQYYHGTLLTMLMDRVMQSALEEGMQAARNLFPNEVLTT